MVIKMYFKRMFAAAFVLVMLLSFNGCSKNNSKTDTESGNDSQINSENNSGIVSGTESQNTSSEASSKVTSETIDYYKSSIDKLISYKTGKITVEITQKSFREQNIKMEILWSKKDGEDKIDIKNNTPGSSEISEIYIENSDIFIKTANTNTWGKVNDSVMLNNIKKLIQLDFLKDSVKPSSYRETSNGIVLNFLINNLPSELKFLSDEEVSKTNTVVYLDKGMNITKITTDIVYHDDSLTSSLILSFENLGDNYVIKRPDNIK